jgi:indole-3-glycerol phosphate synthase
MGTYLDDIVSWHRSRAQGDHRSFLERAETVRYEGPSMLQALNATTSFVKVIAEVKRRSPSKGWIRENLDAGELATQYHEGGASAISVLTDVAHFGGSVADLQAVRRAVGIPILRKDFTVSENDVLDTAEMGASTVLLIAAALSEEELSSFLRLALRSGLDALVEVHNLEEAKRAIDVGARIIGVNQRDLHTFEVNPHHAASVISSLPSDIITVAESGMSSIEDVTGAALAGFDAVLVGETFVRSDDPRETVRSFSSIVKVAHG